jgi:serine/threonine protein kinase
MLYEMLTGKTPFPGEHEAAVMCSIINEEPEPVMQYKFDLSSELIHILDRA